MDIIKNISQQKIQLHPPEPKGGYWFELLTSPGPRKDSGAFSRSVLRELGEDAAGLLQLPAYSFFWLSDGTSQESIWPGFSARILAQDIGALFTQTALQKSISLLPPASAASSLAPISTPNVFYQAPTTHPVNFSCLDLVQSALENLRSAWQDIVNERWRKLLDTGETEAYLHRFTQYGDGLLRVGWSTTFMAGVLQHENKTLEIMNLGDSGCLVQSSTHDVIPTGISGDRIFVQLETSPGNPQPPAVRVSSPKLDTDAVQVFENVEALLCITDGNSATSLTTLFKEHGKRGVLGLAELIKQSRPFTYDDRSLILGQHFGK